MFLGLIFIKMSFECVTLSSDSSRTSSPYSDELLDEHSHNAIQHKVLLRTEEMSESFQTSEPVNTRTNLFSLSDTDSDSNSKRSSSSHTPLTSSLSENLDDFNIKRKRKCTDNLSVEEKKRIKSLKLLEKETLQAAKEYQRSLQPKECTRYVTALIEPKILQFEGMKNIEEKLLEREIKFAIKPHSVQGIVSWSREIVGIQGSKEKFPEKEEEHVLLCLKAEELIKMISDGMLTSHVASMRDFLPDKFFTLVLSGVEEYFRSAKVKKNERRQPKVSRKTIEESLVEIQIMLGIGHRSVENSSEFVSLISMFTKAVAETPFKRDKQEREKSGVLNWFARGDSKDCVRVTSSGHGCSLLWQQQLRQFNNVGLDVAKAVAINYSSPQALLMAYKNCDSVEAAEKLLQNIQVHRRCGPLSSMRKLGPELSRKIYIFFTSFTGNQYLSES